MSMQHVEAGGAALRHGRAPLGSSVTHSLPPCCFPAYPGFLASYCLASPLAVCPFVPQSHILCLSLI